MPKLYKDYFNIDPAYYAAVTAGLIEAGKVDWRKFYPHSTFVDLLQTTYRVLSGAAHRSIWVEGAYGTGKSHAALTIKSLIDASEEEVRAYFDEYNLSRDLRDKFIALKSGSRYLTVYREGTASIDTDTDLILAVQQSILGAMKKQGIENHGDASMKDAFLRWLERPGSRAYFNELIAQEQYTRYFSRLDADGVAALLRDGADGEVEAMMGHVMTVLKDAGSYGLFTDVNDMADWIKSVIHENQLSGVIFVWDEFSEFVRNHPLGLTGFQTLAQISEVEPFYFIIVAHESQSLFADRSSASKILERFERPVRIELPNNMAYKLMAQAMKKTDDPVLGREWQRDAGDLNDTLTEARSRISGSTRRAGTGNEISDPDLRGIVPMHPYAAYVLKNIAVVFAANQRSMFDFIISNDMEDAKGFKWYINTYGPESEDNLLTTDMLWDFFCANGMSGMNDSVRGILENYRAMQADKLFPDEQRVVKVLLLLEAISLRIADDMLAPTDENLELAFMGTEWNRGKAIAIARGLVDKKLIFTKPVAGGKFEYVVAGRSTDIDMKPYFDKAKEQTNTQNLISLAGLMEAVQIPAALKQRYVLEACGHTSFTQRYGVLSGTSKPERFKGLVTFAMDDNEAQQVNQVIRRNMNLPRNELIVIETLTPMGADLYGQYINNLAFSLYHTGKDRAQAEHYQQQAKNVLTTWKGKIESGAFMLYDPQHPNGQRKANLQDLQEALRALNHQRYYYGLEQYALNATMYSMYQLANGAGCGIMETLSGAYRNTNKNLSFEHALEGAWKVPEYWKDPAKQHLPIVQIKKRVDEIVMTGFDGPASEVCMADIVTELEKAPFGFMPSSVAALVLGFVLKEYTTGDYFWSNHSLDEPMTADKMKSMIGTELTQRVNPARNYKPEYIRAMNENQRAFLTGTARAFRIPAAQCASLDSTRDQVRIRMKGLSFPIWCVKHVLPGERPATPASVLERLIDDYTGIANTANAAQGNESTLAEDIGGLFRMNPAAADDLASLFTSEKCQAGMLAYLRTFRDGMLPALAQEIGDGGNYLEEVRRKFNAGDANWVWNIATAEEKISDVILEYQIILESNKSLGHNTSLRETVTGWNGRTNNIRISCEAAAQVTGDLGPFLWQLCYMKQSGGLQEQNKQKFYDLLLTQREAFDRFYGDQVPYFAQNAAPFLEDMSPEEIAEIYGELATGQFTKSKSEYYNYVDSYIRQYKENQGYRKLLKLWADKTQTRDPRDWSDKYATPIMCMFDDSERPAVRGLFSTLNNARPNAEDVDKAAAMLERADFFDRLADPEARDRCFRERVVGDYSVLLTDLNAVRERLRTLRDPAYYWFDNSTVRNSIKSMFDKEYTLRGQDKALQTVESMSVEELRRYLREQIRDNPSFGIQILNSRGNV